MSPFCDAIKVGIAYGAACITYNKTGFSSPMFSTIKEISHKSCNMEKIPLIIADGGISNNGDIAKALVAGADLVMCGSVFATCIDSPAIVDPTDPSKKLYFGSASKLNGNLKNVEGKTISLPINGMTYEEKLIEMQQDLSSAISYAGGENLQAFKEVQYGIV
jgi:GMP reductase